MKKTLLAALVIASLSGCATIREQFNEVTTNNDKALPIFVACSAVDIGSTAWFLHFTHWVEMNPIMQRLTIPVLGHTSGVVVPAIGVAVAGYYFLKWFNDPKVTISIAAAHCAAGVWNAKIISEALY